MLIAILPQRLDEISKELESLCAQSLSHPDKAAEMLQEGISQIQVRLKELTISAGGGHDRSRAGRFCRG